MILYGECQIKGAETENEGQVQQERLWGKQKVRWAMEENKQKNLANATRVWEEEWRPSLKRSLQEKESGKNVVEILQLQNNIMKAKF